MPSLQRLKQEWCHGRNAWGIYSTRRHKRFALIALKKYVRETAKDMTPLFPGAAVDGMAIDKGWRLILNTEVEVEDL